MCKVGHEESISGCARRVRERVCVYVCGSGHKILISPVITILQI